jgi:6-hydroxytryprostatin B O-methyltransferase
MRTSSMLVCLPSREIRAKMRQVGGSTGHISAALAKAYPALTFTVQDLPPMIAKANVSQLSSDIAERIEFVSHNFFHPQPETSRGADVFLLRMILNNWPSSKCEEILTNVAAIMKPGAVMLLNNFMLHEPGTVGKRAEALERARDLFQMAAMNGMERDIGGWNELVGKIAGLKIRQVIRQPGTSQALIVVDKEAS